MTLDDRVAIVTGAGHGIASIAGKGYAGTSNAIYAASKVRAWGRMGKGGRGPAPG